MAEELLAAAEGAGAVAPSWQEPTLLRARWRDAGYAAAWPGLWDAAGDADAAGAEGLYDGWAFQGCGLWDEAVTPQRLRRCSRA